jgi:recombination associated protein RdgC
MFSNVLVYRIRHWQPPSLAELTQRLEGERFIECAATQQESAGWIEPRGEKHAALVESVGGRLILRMRSETRAVPAAVVKIRLDEQLDRIEQDTGRRPRGKATKELKEAIVHELLPRAFPKRSATWVWVDPEAQWLVVDSASVKKSDAIVTRLVELLGGGIALSLLQTQIAPATAMSEWLATRDTPAGFSIDRECELRQPDSEKASVKYARHTLEIDEVAEHIRQGKLPTQLALTWEGRVSFVLNEALTLKRVKLLDVALEGEGKRDEDGGFDADVALVTGELSRLLPDLIEALGGELDAMAAASPEALQPA